MLIPLLRPGRHGAARATTLLALLALTFAARRAPAQSLRGSRASVERAYDRAVAEGVTFQRSRAAVEQAARAGAYARLVNGSGYELRGVSLPYVLPATAAWVGDMATQYRAACRTAMTITSAIRPTALRLRNSIEQSVHPTGMAVDLRAPRGRCRGWLRTTLLAMERRGVIDATEERFPAHFHVVVFGEPAVAARSTERAQGR
jgi:hypothetical protein